MGILARRNFWLRHWEGDSVSVTRIINIPFEGEKYFGEALKPLLVESKDKHMVLTSNKKAPPKKT